MPPRRNILLFHVGALGDFVLTWPVAMAAARLYPQSRVFYVTQSSKGALAEKVLRVESADVELGWHALFSDAPALPESAQRLLDGAHTVISFVTGPADIWMTNVRRLAPEANLVSLSAAATSEQTIHVTEQFVAQLTDAPALRGALEQILRSVAARGIISRGQRREAVLIHPGAGSPDKCWPLDRYLELIHRLKEAGKRVQILLGEVESERWDQSAVAQLSAAAEVATPSNYLELLERMRGASAFVGNDSGPGHLAAIVGTPTLSIFGSTDPARWRPLGPAVRVIRHEPIAQLTAAEVAAALVPLLGV